MWLKFSVSEQKLVVIRQYEGKHSSWGGFFSFKQILSQVPWIKQSVEIVGNKEEVEFAP